MRGTKETVERLPVKLRRKLKIERSDQADNYCCRIVNNFLYFQRQNLIKINQLFYCNYVGQSVSSLDSIEGESYGYL